MSPAAPRSATSAPRRRALPRPSTTNAGWTLGGGLEGRLAANWTAKVEYLYVDLGNFNCGLNCGAGVTDNVSFHTNILRAGVNYRFW